MSADVLLMIMIDGEASFQPDMDWRKSLSRYSLFHHCCLDYVGVLDLLATKEEISPCHESIVFSYESHLCA